MSTDPSTLEGGEKFSREKALPALPHRSAPLAPAASGRSNEAAGAKPSGPPAPPAALRDQVAAAPSSSGPRSGVAGTCGPTRACGVRRGSFLGPAPTGHPPGAAPRPQAKPRRLQPPARSGVLAALESAGPDPRRCGEAVPGVGERERPSAPAASVLCGGSPVPSHGRDPRPLSQTDSARPGRVTPRPPIPHTGAPHWLRSFISRGASLFPARQPISRLPAFSGS